MGIQKKHGKGRLDKWYKLAKEKGYRARAAFKLIQLNKKYGFLEQSKVLIDLCAAPGSWCQVAAETMPVDSLIIGVDLSPIKPISKVITFQSDITTEKCRATIRQHLKTWKADTVLHDGAPNVGTAWFQDSFNQAELVLEALRLATDFLVAGGTFVTKVFRSKDYNPLLWVFNQLFTKVEATKPPSSRNVSAEIFVVCRGFKAPKRIDPRFLDPRSVFAELAAPTPNNEAKVYNPEVKKRKREGYEEGDHLQFKELAASEFIHTTDPIAILANYNKMTFVQPPNGDVALAALDKLPETTSEIRTACADLKVLGRKEFKMLLKWRLRVRDIFGLANTNKASKSLAQEVAEEVAEVESMDEEMKIQKDLEELKNKENSKRKREKRKENERKQKEIVRMQMNMTTGMDIGMEQGIQGGGEGSMFGLKTIKEPQALGKIARGKMVTITPATAKKQLDGDVGAVAPDEDSDEDEDDDGDRLERDLDTAYENYREKKAEADAKYRAKRARKEHEDGEWEGLSEAENAGHSSDDSFELEQDSSDDDDDDNDDGDNENESSAIKASKSAQDGELSNKAQGFFAQDLFKGIPGLEDIDAMDVDVPRTKATKTKADKSRASVIESLAVTAASENREDDDEDDGAEESSEYETVSEAEEEEEEDDQSNWEEEPKRRNEGKIDIDVVTAEAMTLAHQLATGQKTRHDAIDEGFNKHAFRDREGLPEWFMDDEGKHDKPQKPITKAAAAAIKEKLRALNARPIKKVREAKARKKYKAAKKLEKLRKKSDLLAGDEGMTEKEKADSISKMLSKAAKKKPHQPAKLVVARGVNRGVKGRPTGVPKGRRYKLVDPRMKKELRAQKRVSKRKTR